MVKIMGTIIQLSLSLMIVFCTTTAFADKYSVDSYAVQGTPHRTEEKKLNFVIMPSILVTNYLEAKNYQLKQVKTLALQICHQNNPLADHCSIVGTKVLNTPKSDASNSDKDSASLPIDQVNHLQFEMSPSLSEERKGFVHIIKEELFIKKASYCESHDYKKEEKEKLCNEFCNEACSVDYSSILTTNTINQAKILLPLPWHGYEEGVFKSSGNCVRMIKLFCSEKPNTKLEPYSSFSPSFL